MAQNSSWPQNQLSYKITKIPKFICWNELYSYISLCVRRPGIFYLLSKKDKVPKHVEAAFYMLMDKPVCLNLFAEHMAVTEYLSASAWWKCNEFWEFPESDLGSLPHLPSSPQLSFSVFLSLSSPRGAEMSAELLMIVAIKTRDLQFSLEEARQTFIC